jgi:hypothetical protein
MTEDQVQCFVSDYHVNTKASQTGVKVEIWLNSKEKRLGLIVMG